MPPTKPAQSLEYSSSAMQEYLRSKYDENFDDESPLSGYSRNSSALTRSSDITITSTAEPADLESYNGDENDEEPNVGKIVELLLLRDAEQGHFRRMTGESLSTIEQWRIYREVRGALETKLHRTALAISLELTDSLIRTIIGESANRLRNTTASEGPQLLYFNALDSHSRLATPGAESDSASAESTARLKPATLDPQADEVSRSPRFAAAAISNSEASVLDDPPASASAVATDTSELTHLTPIKSSTPSESSVDPARPDQSAVYPLYQTGASYSYSATPFPAGLPHGKYARTSRPSPLHHTRYTSCGPFVNPSTKEFPRY